MNLVLCLSVDKGRGYQMMNLSGHPKGKVMIEEAV